MDAVKPTTHKLNHQLREAFMAEDSARKATEAATIAVSAAQSAKNSCALIQSGLEDTQTRQDSLEFVVKAQAREIKALRVEIADIRNQCMIAGVVCAILGSLISCLVLAPIAVSGAAPQPHAREAAK